MAKPELRGASRREFLKGAVAIGAALGWGPTQLLNFIERGGGLAHADAQHPIQRLVMFVGTSGAHGYMHFLWPHADTYADTSTDTTQTTGLRYSPIVAAPFLQTDLGSGARGYSLGGAIPNTIDYTQPLPKATGGVGINGDWAANERFRRIYGVSNQAFRGFTATNTTSRNIDQKVYGISGTTPIPSNVKADGTRDTTKNFIVVNRHTPFIPKYGLAKAPTVIDGGGINPFHIEGSHNHWIDFNKKWTVMAAAATIQQEIPTTTPVILVGNLTAPDGSAYYGLLPGSPTPATVSSAAGMVDLFNSNAVRAGGALSNPANAVLFEAYTKGFIGTSKTATVPTFTRGYRTGKLSANLVGLNLASQLLPTDTDRVRYNILGNVPNAAELRDRMIVAFNALRLGLTAQVAISYFDDDPHSSFTDGGQGGINASTASAIFSNLLNAFMNDLMSVADPYYPNVKLGDNTVLAFVGDVPRTMLNKNAWNDPTQGGQNRVWIIGNGELRTGFFGGDRAVPGDNTNTNDHLAKGPGEGGLWDLNTGDLLSFDPAGSTGLIGGVDYRVKYGETAMAAILTAITRRDLRRVGDFYGGRPFPALYDPVNM